jgi:hypothetical protein
MMCLTFCYLIGQRHDLSDGLWVGGLTAKQRLKETVACGHPPAVLVGAGKTAITIRGQHLRECTVLSPRLYTRSASLWRPTIDTRDTAYRVIAELDHDHVRIAHMTAVLDMGKVAQS